MIKRMSILFSKGLRKAQKSRPESINTKGMQTALLFFHKVHTLALLGVADEACTQASLCGSPEFVKWMRYFSEGYSEFSTLNYNLNGAFRVTVEFLLFGSFEEEDSVILLKICLYKNGKQGLFASYDIGFRNSDGVCVSNSRMNA